MDPCGALCHGSIAAVKLCPKDTRNLMNLINFMNFTNSIFQSIRK